MSFNKRLLIVLNGAQQAHPALQRGRLIARRLGASLHLMADRRSNDPAPQWLARLAEGLQEEGLQASIEPWETRELISSVLAVQQRLQSGLLIKFNDKEHPLADAFFTPRDWKLLRYLPCPVLMVKAPAPWEGRPVVAAVDADPDDRDHRNLNRQILQVADQVAALSQSPLHLVSAYPSPMQSMDPDAQLEARIARRYRQQCRQLCEDLLTSDPLVEVAEGPPEELIPSYSDRIGAALVVMGTVARRGLRGALLGGNTAEVILGQLQADVLTLKPEGCDAVLEALLQQGEEG